MRIALTEMIVERRPDAHGDLAGGIDEGSLDHAEQALSPSDGVARLGRIAVFGGLGGANAGPGDRRDWGDPHSEGGTDPDRRLVGAVWSRYGVRARSETG